MVRVQYFGSIRAAAELPEEAIAIGGHTRLLPFLRHIAQTKPQAFRAELFEGEALREDVGVTLNGTMVSHAQAADTPLQPGDAIALLPLFPGGG